MKNNSPYSASFTGGSFMFYEMNRLLPLMLDADAENLLNQEIEENNIFMVDKKDTRKRYLAELRRRFAAAPRSFWIEYQSMNEEAQRLALFYVLMKTYRLIFDLHINAGVKKWYSIDCHIDNNDIMLELLQIAASDEFVDSWSDATKKRCISHYITFLNQAGLCDKKSGELRRADVSDYDYAFYLKIGERWFLEACFLQPYEIERIQQLAV